MGQINSTNLPDYFPEAKPPDLTANTSRETFDYTAATPETFSLQDDVQLTKLSNVLNGLKLGAALMREAGQVMGAVQSGTYRVDPLAVSRSIVGDCLAR